MPVAAHLGRELLGHDDRAVGRVAQRGGSSRRARRPAAARSRPLDQARNAGPAIRARSRRRRRSQGRFAADPVRQQRRRTAAGHRKQATAIVLASSAWLSGDAGRDVRVGGHVADPHVVRSACPAMVMPTTRSAAPGCSTNMPTSGLRALRAALRVWRCGTPRSPRPMTRSHSPTRPSRPPTPNATPPSPALHRGVAERAR